MSDVEPGTLARQRESRTSGRGASPVSMRSARTVVSVLLLVLLPLPALAGITLMQDGRFVRTVGGQAPCATGLQSQAPAAAFAGFDGSVTPGMGQAIQQSQASPTLLMGSGRAEMSAACAGVAESYFDVHFVVTEPVIYLLTGTLGDDGGNAVLLFEQASMTILSELSQGAPVSISSAGTLEPGSYDLMASAIAYDGTADFELTLSTLDLPGLPVAGPLGSALLAVGLGLVGARSLVRVRAANRVR